MLELKLHVLYHMVLQAGPGNNLPAHLCLVACIAAAVHLDLHGLKLTLKLLVLHACRFNTKLHLMVHIYVAHSPHFPSLPTCERPSFRL